MPALKYDDDYKAALLEKFKEYVDKTEFPVMARFACNNDVTEQNLYDWSKAGENEDSENKTINSKFFLIYKKGIHKQKAFLIEGGLSSTQKVTMSIFLLKALHGFRDADKQPQQQQQPVTVNLNLEGKTNQQLETITGDLLNSTRIGKINKRKPGN